MIITRGDPLFTRQIAHQEPDCLAGQENEQERVKKPLVVETNVLPNMEVVFV